MIGRTRMDQHDIAEVLIRYASGIDRRDWSRFRTCFTDDVAASYDGIGSWAGVDEITDFMIDAHLGLGSTLHRITNIDIDIDGDTASSRAYVDAVILTLDGSTGVNTLGYYDDELVRTTDGWRIARRTFVAVRTDAIGG